MKSFEIELNDPSDDVGLEPLPGGGAYVWAASKYGGNVFLTREDLVKLRDWLIAYTG